MDSQILLASVNQEIQGCGEHMTILSDVKNACGVGESNLGFDVELLIFVNSGCSNLMQLGVSEFDTIVVDSNTEWPAIGDPVNVELTNFVKHYLILFTQMTFDPVANQAIASAKESALNEVATRITTLTGDTVTP